MQKYRYTIHYNINKYKYSFNSNIDLNDIIIQLENAKKANKDFIIIENQIVSIDNIIIIEQERNIVYNEFELEKIMNNIKINRIKRY